VAKPIEEIKPDKLEVVKELKEKFKKAKSTILVDFRGITVAQATDLRNQLRAEKVEMRVAKNRLVKIALNELGLDPMEKVFKGPTALVFGFDDPVSPVKILVKYAKDNAKLKIKAGILEGKPISVETVDLLSKMSSKDEMLSRMLGSLKSPITRVCYGLKSTMSKLVYAVKAVAEQKSVIPA